MFDPSLSVTHASGPDAPKLLRVIASLNPAHGGPPETLRQQAIALRQLGSHTEVVTLDAPGSSWVSAFPGTVHCLGPGTLGTYQYSARLVPWIEQNAPRFDAVVVHGLWQYHGFATWQALRRSRTPYFVYPHGMLDPWFKREFPLKHLKKSLYWPWAEYRVLRDARAVLFTCEEERQLAKQSFGLYRATEAVMAYGTRGPNGSPEALRESFLARFPQLRGKRLLLFMGRIHPKKGCDLLIEAFANVSSHDPALHLVMAGPDQLGIAATLAARAQRLGLTNVTWTGLLQDDLKWGAFYAAEAFVLPSHQENFGIVVAEALACRLPVLISNHVNIWREVIADGAGIVGDDNVSGTNHLLQSWLRLDQDGRSRMSQNAIDCFRRRFHIDAAVRSLVDCIESHRSRGLAPA
jgi:glycosyltransferase involved in cell wall biosynthesis